MPLPNTPAQDRVVRRTVMTDRQVETMMAILLRNREAFEVAQTRLQNEHFAPQHRRYGLAWSVARDHYLETGELPVAEVLCGEIERRTHADMLGLSDEELAQLDEFVTRAYSEDVLPARSGLIYLRNYLNQALAARLRDEMGAGIEVPQDVFGLLNTYTSRADTIRSLTAQSASDPFPDDWTINEETFNVQSTGIGFLDEQLGGGLGRGEVTGILGPYGSCKTTLGIQITTSMAQQALAEHTSNPQNPLAFSYYLFWEGTTDQVRLRALSCAGWLDRTLMAAGRISQLSPAGMALKPYEQELFRNELAAGQPVLCEQDRLAYARAELNRNWRCICMNGSDPSNPGGGAGLVDEIVSLMRAEENRYREREGGFRIGVIVVDYVGAAIRRHCDAKGLDPTKYTRMLIKDFVDHSARKLAIPLNCSVVLMHQLSGAANDGKPGTVARGSDAAECKSFEENLDFGFVLGKPMNDPSNSNHGKLSAIRCSKHRRTPGTEEPPVFRISNYVARVEETGNRYRYEPGMNRIVDRHDSQMIHGHQPAAVQHRIQNAYTGSM